MNVCPNQGSSIYEKVPSNLKRSNFTFRVVLLVHNGWLLWLNCAFGDIVKTYYVRTSSSITLNPIDFRWIETSSVQY